MAPRWVGQQSPITCLGAAKGRLSIANGQQARRRPLLWPLPLGVHCGQCEGDPLEQQDHEKALAEGAVPYVLPVSAGLEGAGRGEAFWQEE